MKSDNEPKPFFSNPAVKKIYTLIFGIEVTLSTVGIIAAIIREPEAFIPLALIWLAVQFIFLSMIAIIYFVDRFNNWVTKTYSRTAQIIIYTAILVIFLAVIRALFP